MKSYIGSCETFVQDRDTIKIRIYGIGIVSTWQDHSIVRFYDEDQDTDNLELDQYGS